MGLANAIKPLSQCKKSPWRNKSTPPGPRGLHPAGALARTHRGLEYETPSRQELLRAESHQNHKESAHTLPEARGLLSGTTRRGPLSNNRKNRLDPVKIKAKRQLLAKLRPCPRPPTLRLARGLAREASDGLPILRLAQGLARKASDGEPILRLARGWLVRPRTGNRFSDSPEAPPGRPRMSYRFSTSLKAGSANNPIASASTNFSDKMPRPTGAFNRSRDIGRTTA